MSKIPQNAQRCTEPNCPHEWHIDLQKAHPEKFRTDNGHFNDIYSQIDNSFAQNNSLSDEELEAREEFEEYAMQEFYEGEGHEWLKEAIEDEVESRGHDFDEEKFEEWYESYESEGLCLKYYDAQGIYELYYPDEDGEVATNKDSFDTFFQKEGSTYVDSYIKEVATAESDDEKWDREYDEYYENAGELTEEFVSYEAEHMVSFRNGNGNVISADDFSSDYAIDMANGAEPDAYVEISFASEDELAASVNYDDALAGGELPEGWKSDDDDFTIKISAKSLMDPANQSRLQELRDTVNAAGEYMIADSATYSARQNEALGRIMGPTDTRILITELVDSDLENWDYENPRERFQSDDDWEYARDMQETYLHTKYEAKLTEDTFAHATQELIDSGKIDISDLDYNRYANEYTASFDDNQKIITKIVNEYL